MIQKAFALKLSRGPNSKMFLRLNQLQMALLVPYNSRVHFSGFKNSFYFAKQDIFHSGKTAADSGFVFIWWSLIVKLPKFATESKTQKSAKEDFYAGRYQPWHFITSAIFEKQNLWCRLSKKKIFSLEKTPKKLSTEHWVFFVKGLCACVFLIWCTSVNV